MLGVLYNYIMCLAKKSHEIMLSALKLTRDCRDQCETGLRYCAHCVLLEIYCSLDLKATASEIRGLLASDDLSATLLRAYDISTN